MDAPFSGSETERLRVLFRGTKPAHFFSEMFPFQLLPEGHSAHPSLVLHSLLLPFFLCPPFNITEKDFEYTLTNEARETFLALAEVQRRKQHVCLEEPGFGLTGSRLEAWPCGLGKTCFLIFN